MHRVAELLPEVYRKLAREAVDEEALLLALWPVVVGKKVAARTRPVRLFRDTLVVEVVAQDWRTQLSRMTADIVDRLNTATGKVVVRDLQFRVAGQQKLRPPQSASGSARSPGDEAAEISDPYLRRLYRLSRSRAKHK